MTVIGNIANNGLNYRKLQTFPRDVVKVSDVDMLLITKSL